MKQYSFIYFQDRIMAKFRGAEGALLWKQKTYFAAGEILKNTGPKGLYFQTDFPCFMLLASSRNLHLYLVPEAAILGQDSGCFWTLFQHKLVHISGLCQIAAEGMKFTGFPGFWLSNISYIRAFVIKEVTFIIKIMGKSTEICNICCNLDVESQNLI